MPEQRRAVRAERSGPIADELHQLIEAWFRQVSAKSKSGGTIHYALTRWNGLAGSLKHGQIDLNSKTVERSISRRVSLVAKDLAR
jgi:transposase